ncbi:PhzF family phenazine biosynthesis isomerase [Bowmanella sp. Y26]|uniref:PhzF family phenazine biosynthesis protein n=1 Tax=Bowmanella yangjiangensis TaxID=2811230 RepID=UPI001BDD5D1D|nr:PhzF family phenazine biosynthesis isomerase [Bowmanella yangjiangensis]MBT1061988.1 PhzF family phenazine biosynthesis isomerase [Bowmanella yangjiangensis]
MKSSALLCFRINVFSCSSESGNPASVILSDRALSAVVKQRLAKKLGTAETAFVTRMQSGFVLEFFTPVVPVRSCGHASLAAACAVDMAYPSAGKTICFLLHGEPLIVEKKQRSQTHFSLFDRAWHIKKASSAPVSLLAALNIQGNQYPFFHLTNDNGRSRCAILLPDEATLFRLHPGNVRLSAFLSEQHTGCFAFTYCVSRRESMVGRFFAPHIGIDEDIYNGNSAIAAVSLANYICAKSGFSGPDYLNVSQGKHHAQLSHARVSMAGHDMISSVALEAELHVCEHFYLDEDAN